MMVSFKVRSIVKIFTLKTLSRFALSVASSGKEEQLE